MTTWRGYLIALATLFVAVTAGAQAPTPTADGKECERWVVRANKKGILGNIALEHGHVVVTVRRSYWRQLDFQNKTALARTVACTITSGERGKTARVEIRDEMENRILGQYDGAELTVP